MEEGDTKTFFIVQVESVREQQKQAERTMMEHDISRFNPRYRTHTEQYSGAVSGSIA